MPPISVRPGAVLPQCVFAYEKKAHVLRRLSFHIAAGRVRRPGRGFRRGKSTLCALIPRFYEVDGGAILHRWRRCPRRDAGILRRKVGVVQQDVYLFSGTVEDNLRYGRPDATDEEIMAAARAANAHDFIMRLPEGYDTDVGQRGVKLSGGQKQRLTIARAFLKNPAS